MDAISCYNDDDSSSSSSDNDDTNIAISKAKEVEQTTVVATTTTAASVTATEKETARSQQPVYTYKIPAAPPQDEVDPALRQKVEDLFRKRDETGRSINSELNRQPIFSNPSFLDKLAATYNIDETGTQCSPQFFNPHGALSTDFTITD